MAIKVSRGEFTSRFQREARVIAALCSTSDSEMATGVRPPATCGVALPARFAEVVQRCLNVDPDERWQSARDLQTQLEWMLRDMQDPDVPRTRDSRIAWRWALGTAATLAFRRWVPFQAVAPSPAARPGRRAIAPSATVRHDLQRGLGAVLPRR